MPRSKAPPRVKGPYAERSGTRFRIRICDLAGQRDLYFPTMKDALAGMKAAEREIPNSRGRTLGKTLDEYIEDKIQRGLCAVRSAREQQSRLRVWLADVLDDELDNLTAKRAMACYEQLVAKPCRKTGRPPAVATHRFYLQLAQMLFSWAVRRGYLRENPFAKIQPVGRPQRGKKQLRFDEAERFITAAFQRFDEQGDTMALAAVTVLLLGCRASEILNLRIRDLDCGGTRLWIAARDGDYRGKTQNATRDPDVPEVLQPRLLRLAADRAPDDYLFGLGATGQPRRRQALHVAVRKVCVSARVPIVCPHSLRGLWATAGIRSGALSHTVAAALGHGSFAVTAKHYVQPRAFDGARTERLMQLLDLSAAKQPALSASPSAEQLLASLPPETLARLLELASQASRPPES